MNLATAVWHILQGKPIPKDIAQNVVRALRESPDYLRKISNIAKVDHEETLSPKLAKYAEKYRKSPNQSGTIKPILIMLHHTSGNFWGSVSWILKQVSRVSYHYIINPKDGSRIQFVWDNKKAWHAGKSFWKGYSGLNAHSVSIAFDRDTNKRTPSPEEIDSCARKCIYLMEKFDLNEEDIITHEMATKGRKTDCSQETHRLVLERISELKNR